jgi:hypothetical protein
MRTGLEEILACPALLTPFHLLSYANLKKYTFDHHFSFPVLPSKWIITNTRPVDKSQIAAIESYIAHAPPPQRGFFVIIDTKISPLSALLTCDPKMPVLSLLSRLILGPYRILELLHYNRECASAESPNLPLSPSQPPQTN